MNDKTGDITSASVDNPGAIVPPPDDATQAFDASTAGEAGQPSAGQSRE